MTIPKTRERLTSLAAERSPGARSTLLREVASLFAHSTDRCTPRALEEFDAVLTRLAAHADPAARVEIADMFADIPDAPSGFVRALAEDRDLAVAGPVLRRSRALDAEALAEIARRAEPARLRALAARGDIPGPLAMLLAERGDAATLSRLIQNRAAKLAPGILNLLIDRAREHEPLQPLLADRHDLTPILIARLYFMSAQSARRKLLERAELLDPATAGEGATACRRLTLEELESLSAQDVSLALLEDCIRQNTVEEGHIREFARAKNRDGARLALAAYCAIAPGAAQKLLADRSWRSLALACRAAEFERATFAAIAALFLTSPKDKARAEQMHAAYLKIPIDAADALMRFWRIRPVDGDDTEIGALRAFAARTRKPSADHA